VRELLDLGVVYGLGLRVEAVGDRVEVTPGEAHLGAVREVAARVERHAEYGVTRVQHGVIHRRVRLRPGMGLYVGVAGIEQLFRAVDCELFRNVHEFATAVIALAGVALRVLIGEHRTLGLEYGRADVVLGCDQLDMGFLAPVFLVDRAPQFRVTALDGVFGRKHLAAR